MRIVSLLPSATEIICSLDLREQLAGVTHECDFPPDVTELPKVTKTLIPTDADSGEVDRLVKERLAGGAALYELDMDRLESLAPDLIVSQTLCDVCAVADRELREAQRRLPKHAHVLYLEPRRLADVLANIQQVAYAADVADRGREVVTELEARLDGVREAAHAHRGEGPVRVVLLEWLDPLFSSGHWNPELVQIAGGVDPLARAGERSRQINPEELVAARPDLLLIAACGFTAGRAMQDVPRLREHPVLRRLECVQQNEIYVADGNAYFSRPGPRLVDSAEIVAGVLQPDRFPLGAHLKAAIRAK